MAEAERYLPAVSWIDRSKQLLDQARPDRRCADLHPAHQRLPERLLAALSGRNRPGRQGARPLQPDARRRPSRPAPQSRCIAKTSMKPPSSPHLSPLLARYAAERQAAANALATSCVRSRRRRRRPERPQDAARGPAAHESALIPKQLAESPTERAPNSITSWPRPERPRTASPGPSITCPDHHALSSSFGAQAAVSLHHGDSARVPDLPVIRHRHRLSVPRDLPIHR